MLSEYEGVAVLEQAECLELLGRSSIGRVGVSMGAVPAVFPVNFAVLDQAIVFWASTGTKLDAATRNAVVAFEVDDVDALYHEGWSVLVVGIADELRDAVLVERAKRLPLAPWAEGPHEHMVAIRPEFISGRRIVHRSRLATAEVEGSARY
ncbi:MAG: pyridoxamine 5'-phosphate oxidase family protein [Acidimicrobiales bacterium]|jgi:nitroimidazol reductase NimA-like FMN-containing flavoprotein (pyridoxamine 5'-phosphate oxidase superfamily)